MCTSFGEECIEPVIFGFGKAAFNSDLEKSYLKMGYHPSNTGPSILICNKFQTFHLCLLSVVDFHE